MGLRKKERRKKQACFQLRWKGVASHRPYMNRPPAFALWFSLFFALLPPPCKAQQGVGFQGNFRIESGDLRGRLELGKDAQPVFASGKSERRLGEMWSLQKNADGSYFLVSNEDGRMLKVEHWLGLSVLRAAPYDEEEAESFKWRLEPAENGFFRIVSAAKGEALHLKQLPLEKGGRLSLSLGAEGLRWRLQPLRKEEDRRRGVVLFSEKRFRGKRRPFPQGAYSSSDFAPLENDQVLSVAVPRGWQVVLFEHSFFRGRRLTLTESVEDLSILGFGRKVSSLLVQPHRRQKTPSGTPPAGRIPRSPAAPCRLPAPLARHPLPAPL